MLHICLLYKAFYFSQHSHFEYNSLTKLFIYFLYTDYSSHDIYMRQWYNLTKWLSVKFFKLRMNVLFC